LVLPPESPPLIQIVAPTDFGFVGMPGPAEGQHSFLPLPVDPPFIVAPGITYGAPSGYPFPVTPYPYNSVYYGPSPFLPSPVSNLYVHLKYWFNETMAVSPQSTELVTRQIHIALYRTSDNANLGHYYRSGFGTRYGPVKCELNIGPLEMPDPFTIHCYCLWNSWYSAGGGAHNHTVYNDRDGFTVTGDYV
jgi:hypothetical protein